MTTAEAASRLAVKRETLYAYASRGLLTPQHSSRGSTYDPHEIERLAAASRVGAAAGRAGRSAPSLGFVTALTLIEDGRLRYRGQDAIELSRQRSFEEVAGWLWTGRWGEHPAPWLASQEGSQVAAAATALVRPATRPADRFKVAVAAAATADVWRHHLGAQSVSATGRAVVATMVEVLPPARPRRPVGSTDGEGIAARLWGRLSTLAPGAGRVAVLDAALVLLADHELAASTLAARVAAAFGADPYAVISTGLGAASGTFHAANSDEVVGLLEDALARGPSEAVARLLQRDQRLPGFGQVLYPGGDPRCAELLERVKGLDLPPARRAVVEEVATLGQQRALSPPNVDFALGALAFGQSMRPGAGEAIFTLARCAGWIAHALEEYASRTSFRVRASYVGPR